MLSATSSICRPTGCKSTRRLIGSVLLEVDHVAANHSRFAAGGRAEAITALLGVAAAAAASLAPAYRAAHADITEAVQYE